MSRQTRWLFSQIERWTAERIVTAEQAARIRALYPEAPAVSWGMAVFFGIGAIVAGLGVILLVAYNWDEIPKFGKLALIFGIIAASHGGGLWLRARPDWRRHVGEACGLFGTMMFGSGIWLVAQIYNIDEHFPNGFLLWGLGALALAWTLPSVGQAIVATVTLTIWSLSEVLVFDVAALDWSPLLLLAAIGPLVWRLRSAVLAAVLLVALHVIVLSSSGKWNDFPGAMTSAVALSSLLIAGEKLAGGRWLPARVGSVMRFLGFVGFLLAAFIFSFAEAAEEVVEHASRWRDGSPIATAHRWVWFALALAAWAAVGWLVKRGRRRLVSLEEWLVPATLLFDQGIAIPWLYRDKWLVAAVFNVAFLMIAAMWVDRGCREGRPAPTILGSVLVAVLVWARYFDLFESLATRGTVFLVLGAALFAEGFYYRKLRKLDAGRAAA